MVLMFGVGLEQLCRATINIPFSHDTTDGDWGRVRRTSSVARTAVCCSSQHIVLGHLLGVPALPLSFARLGTRVTFNGRALEAKEQGNTLYKQGKYANAIDMYTKAIGLSRGASM
jgi:tetratricopeptide (TPR) repeat protein